MCKERGTRKTEYIKNAEFGRPMRYFVFARLFDKIKI